MRLLIPAGTLLYHTLVFRGLAPDKISVHHLNKGNSVHSDAECGRMAAYNAERAVVLDQGSRPGRELIPKTPSLIIDHHMSDQVSSRFDLTNSSGLTTQPSSPLVILRPSRPRPC